jgi:hypothetical protein
MANGAYALARQRSAGLMRCHIAFGHDAQSVKLTFVHLAAFDILGSKQTCGSAAGECLPRVRFTGLAHYTG